jgi:4-amino-4-deoxy-L-arabinose transferase-like glycosyltransferase
VIALALRVWGIGFGLPQLYHPDEPAHVLQALAIARGLPNGVTFANPPLYKYLLFAEYVVTYGIGWLTHLYSSPQDFVNRFRADPTLLYLIGRVTSALLGALTVFAAYALANALRGRHVGLRAALLAAVVYLLVRESHFAVNDAFVTLCVTLALYACVRVAQFGSRRDYLVAGALVGLSFAAKYQGAVALFPFLLAHLLRPQRDLKQLVQGAVAAGAVTLVGFPPLFLETRRVLQDFYVGLYSKGQIGYDGLDPAGGYVFYMKALLWGIGLPILLAAGLGVMLALVRRERGLIVVASLPLALYLIMGYERLFFARYILPAVPALLVLALVGLENSAEWLAARTRFSPRVILFIGVCVLGIAPLIDSLRFDTIMMQEDTRTAASVWINSHLAAGTRVAVDWGTFSAPLSPSRYDLLVANGWQLSDLTLDDYRQRGIHNLVASSYIYDQWLLNAESEAKRKEFYAALPQHARVVAEFRPYRGDAPLLFVYDQIYAPFNELDRLERPGPTIRVYELQ